MGLPHDVPGDEKAVGLLEEIFNAGPHAAVIPFESIHFLTGLDTSQVRAILVAVTGAAPSRQLTITDVAICQLYEILCHLGFDETKEALLMAMSAIRSRDLKSIVDDLINRMVDGEDVPLVALQVLDGRYLSISSGEIDDFYDAAEMAWVSADSLEGQPLVSTVISVPELLQRNVKALEEFVQELESRSPLRSEGT